MREGSGTWKEEFVEKAFQLALLGATDKMLATALDVECMTVNRWKYQHPEFGEALKNGRLRADAKVAASLYQRAIGYDYEEEVVVAPKGREPQVIKVKRHVRADVWAAAKWLALRQREYWAEVQRTDPKVMTVNILKLDLSGFSVEELKLAEKLGLKALAQETQDFNNVN